VRSHRVILNLVVQYQELDRTFSALADPTRRDILERLAAGPASVTELAEPYGISLPGVLKHIRILERADLVATEKRGRTRECRLGPADMDDAYGWIEHQRALWQRRFDRLDSYLARTTKGATHE
jgi:DNA-binding transcriptional ArsR family regulator